MKISVTPEFISALALSRLTFIYIRNNNFVNVIIIVRKSFLRFFTI